MVSAAPNIRNDWYWVPRIAGNVARDREADAALARADACNSGRSWPCLPWLGYRHSDDAATCEEAWRSERTGLVGRTIGQGRV
jgi:hypothetical protein